MKHGGDLSRLMTLAPHAEPLDLSTGIAPVPYPFAPPPAECWTRLPQQARLDALLEAARAAYGAPPDAPIAAAGGTQLLIQLLPEVIGARRVAIVGPTYSEHALCWRRAGAEVIAAPDLEGPQACEALVAVNPNNPDGRLWPREAILSCAAGLARRGGVLIVDESFADVAPEASVAGQAGRDGLIVLRSFGKFFGLAGVRLGFALGPQPIVERLDAALGPWAVSGPAIEIGIEGLNDRAWIAEARQRYAADAARLRDLLREAGLSIVGGTSLYVLTRHAQARGIHRALARRGILTRVFEDEPCWLRFGLPCGDAAFARLADALAEAVREAGRS